LYLSPRVALPIAVDSCWERGRLERTRERLERGRRQRSEEGHRAQERHLDRWHGRVAVDVEQSMPSCAGDERQDRADAQPGKRCTDEPDEQRDEERTHRARAHQEALE